MDRSHGLTPPLKKHRDCVSELAQASCGKPIWPYNTVRPHSSLGYRPPAPEAMAPRLDSAAPRFEAMAAGALT